MPKNIKKEKEDKDCDCGCGCGCGHDSDCKCRSWRCRCCRRGGGGAIYGLGFIGAAIYFISHATGFWNVVLAILKAAVWPAFLVLKVLGM